MSRAVRSPLYSPLLRPTALAAEMMRRGTNALTFGVTLSSVVGGLPASGTGIVTINQVAPVNAITPVIAVSRSTGVAPLAVTFDALGTTAPALTSLPFGEIYYAWTFGDAAGGATWAYGTRPGVNLKNEAIGPVAAHVFETHSASPYTVTCWAFYLDSGGTLHSGSSTTSITVTNPDTVFASNTIYISQSGVPVPGVGGVPPGANVQQVTTWSTIETLAQTYKRILLRRGDTWVSTVRVGLDQVSRAGPGIIGAYGSGNKPLMQMNSDQGAFSFGSNCPEWRIMDLEVDAINLDSRLFSRVISGPAQETLFLRCELKRARDIVNIDSIVGLTFADCVLGPNANFGTEYGYGIYSANSIRLTLLGTQITQSGGPGAHVCRVQGTRLGVFSNNSMAPRDNAVCTFTLRGWSPYTGTEWSENNVATNNYFSGAANTGTTWNAAPQNNESAERIRNFLGEGNFVHTPSSNPAGFSVANGLFIRNNIFVTGVNDNVQFYGTNTAGSPYPSQASISNNTYYCYATGSFGSCFSFTGTVSGHALTNNIAYRPNVSSTTFTNGTGANGTFTNNSTTAQVLGNRPWAAVTPGTTPAAAADYTPSGSYAVDGGTWVPVYKNYFGTTASGTREIGAI
jgi:hypothetical protein